MQRASGHASALVNVYYPLNRLHGDALSVEPVNLMPDDIRGLFFLAFSANGQPQVAVAFFPRVKDLFSISSLVFPIYLQRFMDALSAN